MNIFQFRNLSLCLALSSLLAPGAVAREGQNHPTGRDPLETVALDVAESERVRTDAEKGDAQAQVELGRNYQKGAHVPQDFSEAVKWYRKAADQGLAEGQSCLGEMYRKGNGVAKDAAEAIKWYRLAADQGFHSAQACLGQMYMRGEGVTKDDVEALKWFKIAGKESLDLGAYFDSKVILSRLNREQVAEAQKQADEFVSSKPKEKAGE